MYLYGNVVGYRDGSCIEPADVCQAICQRREFDLLTQQGLQVNSLPNDYLRKGATIKEPPQSINFTTSL